MTTARAGGEVWDLAIVGAGPAGATAAIAALRARPGARVLLLDRVDFPRDKPCGDGIAPHVLDVLERLGVHGLLDDQVPVALLDLRFGGVSVARRMRRAAWVVPRTLFDARLVDAATDAGAQLVRHRVRRVESRRRSVVLDGTIEARVVIAADGAYSVVRAALGAPAPQRWALALRGYAPTVEEAIGRQLIRFGTSRRPAYAWGFDAGDGRANVGYGELLGRATDRPTRQLMLERLEDLIPGTTREAESWRGHHLPLSTTRWRHPEGRVLFAGDAAALVNPVTGEGIYYAVASGACAGRAAVLAPGQAVGGVYGRVMRQLLRTHLWSAAGVARVTDAPAVLRAGLRAAGADQGVFDDLVELGLGRGTLTGRAAGAVVRHALPPLRLRQRSF